MLSTSTQSTLSLCLFQEKEEGKIVRGGKDGGMINFPSFGTTTKSKGRKDGDGSHINIVSSHIYIWTESRRDIYFFCEKSKKPLN
jgi:hypothetical protein